MSYSGDPLEDVISATAKGATEGILEWSDSKISKYLDDFKNKKIAFVQDPEFINQVKQQRKKGEWAFFKTYTPHNDDVYALYQTGMTLRDYESDRNKTDFIIKKIIKRHKIRGLHIAWFAQNELFSKYIGYTLENGATTEEIRCEVKNLFENIDNKVAFISKEDGKRPRQRADQIITKINSHTPDTFIISSVGGAVDACEKIKNNITQIIDEDYHCELYLSEQKGKRIYFLTRKP